MIVHYTKDVLSTYIHNVLINFTDASCIENEAYNIVDHDKKFPCDGAGTSGDEKQMKDVYEEVYIWVSV